MKQNYALIFLIIFLIFSLRPLNAQNQTQIEEIKRKTNLQELQKLETKFRAQQTEQRRRALELAQINNWPTFYLKDGSFFGLIGVTEDNRPIYYKTNNEDAARSTRTDWLHNGGGLGLDIEGQGMTAYVWDGGVARSTHQEYDGIGGENRFTNADSGSQNFHAAHVMGTIISSGLESDAKGMAPQALGVGYDWNNDITEATAAAANGMMISNHSYGFGASSIPDAWFGQYISLSRDWDELMYNSPYYMMVVAAGNDGNDNSSNDDPLDGNPFFDKLSGFQTSKNNIVVANALDASIDTDGSLISVTRNTGSSEGPTDDLRVKPDIMGNGTAVKSTYHSSDDDYGTISGTSMASPNVAGSLLLLQKYYHQVNGVFMRASTLKGLALHTADDVGPVGPDANHGWGLMNTKKAAETITNNGLQSWVEERILEQGASYTITLKSDETNPFMASISWTDLPGQVSTSANNGTPILVNDLDIQITKDSDTFSPWKLTGVNTNDKGDNMVDPYERIDIEDAFGEYTITITHKGALASGPQAYALIVTGVDSNFTFNTANSNQVVCSDTSLEYMLNYQQTGPVTTNFSVEGLPTGATASFSSPSLSENGTTTLTISNLSSVPAGEYEFTVIGEDGEETESRIMTMRVYHPNFDDNPVVISSPISGTSGVASPQVIIQWDENLNAESYQVEVSDNPAFTTILASGTESDTDFAASGLVENTIYYWRIRPENRCAVGEYSETYSFQTGIEDCTSTYTATDFDNAIIFESAGNTAFVPIEIDDDITIGRLIVQADIPHNSVEDITVFVQQPPELGSNNTILLNGACDTSDDILNVTFDDNGGEVACNAESPAITGVVAPLESLTSSAGLSSKGRWFFAVTDNILFGGGRIDAASITVCTGISNTNIPSFTNNLIGVAANGSTTIQTSDIEVSTSSETADQQRYTLVELPEKGNILKNGNTLSLGDTFTQEDVNSGVITYANTQTQLFTDSFKADITNGENGWLPNQQVNIEATTVGTSSFELSNFSLYPNPSQGMISIRFESRDDNPVDIQVFDFQGRRMFAKKFDAVNAIFNQNIHIGNLANGVYLVRINQGDRTIVKNVMVLK
ncbi:MAG: S8 family serine peptidase [Flavobacteriales bacterium]|nr:S8 family serine peptidase [Flavobacteriales bacterium]